jgi:hypothetical protein
VLGWDAGVELGIKTIPECLITDAIPNIEQLAESGVLDRFDSFMVSDHHTWSVLAARYGEAWVLLMPLPSIYSEMFRIDRVENKKWQELRDALDANGPIQFTTLNTLQWCIFNRRNVIFPRVLHSSITQFLADIDTRPAEFATLNLDQLRERMAERFADLLQVLPQLATARNTGPFWVHDRASRIESILNIVKSNFNEPTAEARRFASFAITGRSNSQYPLREWCDFDTTIPRIFDEYRSRALPYAGSLTVTAITVGLDADTASVDARVDDILNRWSTVKTADPVLNAQKLAYIMTNNPDAAYVTNIVDLGDNKRALGVLIRLVLYEHDLDIAPAVRISIDSRLPCFNLGYIAQNVYKGYHRSGWQYVANHLALLHSKSGVLMDNYIDRTFHWNLSAMRSLGIVPYTQPWTGFIHHTPLTSYNFNATRLFQVKEFVQSLSTCQGLFVLSNTLAAWVRNRLAEIGHGTVSVVALTHPTETPQSVFTMQQFSNSDRKIVQVGGWLRDPFNIYQLELGGNALGLSKTALRGRNMDLYSRPHWFDAELAAGRLTIHAPESDGADDEHSTTQPSSNYTTAVSELINPTSITNDSDNSDTEIDDEEYMLPDYTSRICCLDQLPLYGSSICGDPTFPPGNDVPSGTEHNNYMISDTTLGRLRELIGENRFITAVVDWLRDRGVDVEPLLENGTMEISEAVQQRLQEMLRSVKIIERVDDSSYDALLASSIVSIRLLDASAVNTVIECIVRNTPIAINRVPAVVEILGGDYPFYTLPDGGITITEDKVAATTAYLQKLPKHQYSIEHFLESLYTSTIGRRCWLVNRAREDGYEWATVQPYMLRALSSYTDPVELSNYADVMERIYHQGLISYDMRSGTLNSIRGFFGSVIGGVTNWAQSHVSQTQHRVNRIAHNTRRGIVHLAQRIFHIRVRAGQ